MSGTNNPPKSQSTIDSEVNEILVSYAEEAILIVSDGHIIYEEQDAESAALYRNLARAAHAITNLIAQEANKAVVAELKNHIHPHAIWYKDLGSVRDTQPVAGRIARLTADKEQADG